MKGIVQRMREVKPVILDGKISTKDIEELSFNIKQDILRQREWLKERRANEKALNKIAKELNKEIPFEVAWHCFLAPYQTYVGGEFFEKYKEWL